MITRVLLPSLLPPVHALGPTSPIEHADKLRHGAIADAHLGAHDLPVPKGVSEVAMYGAEHGFNHLQIQELARFANQRDMVIVMAATNSYCAELAKLGHPVVPTELEIQAEHQFGPLSGFVPKEKIGMRDRRELERSRRVVSQFLSDGRARCVELTISGHRIRELEKLKALVLEKGRTPGTSWLICEKDGKSYVFSATPPPQAINGYRIAYEKKPIQVLGKDYGDYVVPYMAGKMLWLEKGIYQHGKDKRTDIESTDNLLDSMNVALGRTLANPIAYTSNNSEKFLPSIFFGPEKSGIPGAAYAKDEKTFVRLKQAIKDAGYPLISHQEAFGGRNRVHGMRETLLRKLADRSATARFAAFDSSTSETPLKTRQEKERAPHAILNRDPELSTTPTPMSLSELLRQRASSRQQSEQENTHEDV